MDAISAFAVGIGAAVVGGIVLAIEKLEEDNKRKESELDRLRVQIEHENRERAAELKRLATLNDAYAVLQKCKLILDTAAQSERAAYSNWKAAKSQMNNLKKQAQCVKRERRKTKGNLRAYIRKQTRYFWFLWFLPEKVLPKKNVDIDKDKNVCETRKKLRMLREFQESVTNRIRTYARVKRDVWDAMQIQNRQKQAALRQWRSTKMAKQYFECVSCGNKFAVTVSKLSDFHERGFQPPKRCPKCRGQRKLNMRG